MPFRTKCPSCQTTLSVPDSAAGKSARCRSCQKVFKIPSPSGPQAKSSPVTVPQKSPQSAASGGRVIKCPGCQSGMRLPAGSQGKVLACPRCQKKFRVSGAPTTKPAAAAKPKPQAPARLPAERNNLGSGDLDDFDFGDLDTRNTSGPNPYVPPSPGFGAASAYASPNAYAPPSQYTASARPANRSSVLYIIPGVLILIWSIFLVGFNIFRVIIMGIAMATDDIPAEVVPRLIGMLVGGLLVSMIGVVMALGSFNMIRQTGLSTARTAAIVAIIPCFGGCVFPIGIWATILLYTGSVKKDFYD